MSRPKTTQCKELHPTQRAIKTEILAIDRTLKRLHRDELMKTELLAIDRTLKRLHSDELTKIVELTAIKNGPINNDATTTK